ncbi:MAG: hypothetical protein JO366_16115 [Methylobacteriaceae bacterium]|nr:hypothetical protein [Methylobacteriaceae bacterium]
MSDEPPDEEDLEAFVPSWDQDVADAAVGKTILAGVTYFESDGQTLRSQEQYHGIIVSVDPKVGVHVRCAGKVLAWATERRRALLAAFAVAVSREPVGPIE